MSLLRHYAGWLLNKAEDEVTEAELFEVAQELDRHLPGTLGNAAALAARIRTRVATGPDLIAGGSVLDHKTAADTPVPPPANLPSGYLPAAQPLPAALPDRRVYLACDPVDAKVMVFESYAEAAALAREWGGVIVELPLIADFRQDPAQQAVLRWRRHEHFSTSATPPIQPVMIEAVDAHAGRLTVTYRLALSGQDEGQ